MEEVIKTSPLLKQSTALIESAHDALCGVDSNPTIPKSEFDKYFLPLFSGNLETKEQYDEVMNAWITIVSLRGSTPVNVINPDGSIFAIVPPVIDTSPLYKVLGSKGDSFTNLFEEFTLRSNNPSAHAELRLNNKLQEKLDSLDSKEISNVTDWMSFFKAYDMVPAELEDAGSGDDDLASSLLG